LGQLVLLQLVYEASAACTSIVVPQDPTQGDSIPQHIRTMDWGMEFLRPLTIEVEFTKGGRTLYVATTWVGYVGVLTGNPQFVVSEHSEQALFQHPVDELHTNTYATRNASVWVLGFCQLPRHERRLLEERQESHPARVAHRYYDYYPI
jgi:hypothetical protein